MSKQCKKGIGTKETHYADRCYWLYNGECIRPDKEPCLYNLEKKAMSKRAEEVQASAILPESIISYAKEHAVLSGLIYREGVKYGYEQAEKDLGWHSVKESLPPTNEEVIVLTDDIHGKTVKGANYICFGHIVDKSITVDYNGWNISGVHHWMYCPKI